MFFDNQNLCNPNEDFVPFPVHIYVSTQLPLLVQMPSLPQLVSVLLQQLNKNWGKITIPYKDKFQDKIHRCNKYCIKRVKVKRIQKITILLIASEKSIRWSSMPWTRGCWIISCTAFSEFKIDIVLAKPFSCWETLAFPCFQQTIS